MKPKLVYVDELGGINRHKSRKHKTIGCGMVYPNQYILLYTSLNREIKLSYEELRLGNHERKFPTLLQQNEKVNKIDLLTFKL